ncbi:MAG: PepSY domain-containing protein [Polyangiaceae bacterium]
MSALGRARFVTVLALLVSVAAQLSAPARADSKRVPLEEARRVALRRVPGTVLEEALEYDRGKEVYTFNIRPRRARPPDLIVRVKVDPGDGHIISVRREDEDDEARR